MSEISEILRCPFCLSQSIEAKSGGTNCPECHDQFEIDDRLECIFGDTDNNHLPAIGTICTSCGLFQAGSHQNCSWCGTALCTAVQ